MRSLIKVILMSMYRKKARSLILIVSIIFSVGLSYTILTLSDLTEDIVMSQYKKEYGETDILVHNLDYSFIEEELVIESNQYHYLINGFNIYGYTYLEEDLAVNAFGFTKTEYETVYNIGFENQLDTEFNSNYIIIGEKNSDLYNIKINDEVDIRIGNEQYTFIVHSIATEGTSFLDYTPNTLDVILTKDFINNTLGFEQPNVLLIRSNNTTNVEEIIENNDKMVLTELFDSSNIDTEMQKLIIPLGIMALAVVLIGAYIMASTFKVIIIDRMMFLGTLRSIGATKGFTTKVLLIESALYGLIGSLIGVFTGFGLLNFMAKSFFGPNFSEGLDVNYVQVPYLILSITFGVLVSVSSAMVPILKTNNYAIKDILFQKIKNNTKFSLLATIIGILLIVSAFVLMNNVGTNDYMTFSLLTIVLSLAGGVLVIPLLIKLISPVISKVSYPLFKSQTRIAVMNINNDKTLINNIILLSIGLGTIFMINSFSSDVGRAVNEIYDEASYDMIIINEDIEDDFIEVIQNIDGVDNVYATASISNIETTNGFVIPYLDGINPKDYEQYGWDIFNNHLSEDVIEQFNNEDAIIITSFMAKKYEVELGDEIGIEYKGNIYQTTVVAIFPTILQNGTQCYINESLFEEVFEDNASDTVYIAANGDLDGIKKDIKESYLLGILPIVTLEEMKEINEGNNRQLFTLMRGVSILAMLIGAIGIINNFFVSFISRRKLVATLRSLGLSKLKTIKLFIVESTIVGFIGSIIGIVFGIMLYYFMGFVVEGLDISSEVQTFNINEMIFIFVSGMLICLLTSIIPSITMARKNIVSEIKYE